MGIEKMIQEFYENDDKQSYKTLLQLEQMSEQTSDIYFYFDEFLKMLDDEKSYNRVRGFRLICKNAKWDNENKINKSIEKILLELEDEKPTALRQCLVAIKELVKYKKELHRQIKDKLLGINYLNYKDSMQSLIFKDVDEVLKLIKESK